MFKSMHKCTGPFDKRAAIIIDYKLDAAGLQESTFKMTGRHAIFRMRVIIFSAFADESCCAHRTYDVDSLLHGDVCEDRL